MGGAFSPVVGLIRPNDRQLSVILRQEEREGPPVGCAGTEYLIQTGAPATRLRAGLPLGGSGPPV